MVPVCGHPEPAPVLILAMLGVDPARAHRYRFPRMRIRSGNIAQTALPIAISPSIDPHSSDFERVEGDSGCKGPRRFVSGDNWAALAAGWAMLSRSWCAGLPS